MSRLPARGRGLAHHGGGRARRAGEGPQLTALFAVRHRESPEHMRGQIFTTAASLKIGGLAAGAALAGPLAGRSVTACLLAAAGFELCAAAAYVLIGPPPKAATSIAAQRAGRRYHGPFRIKIVWALHLAGVAQVSAAPRATG